MKKINLPAVRHQRSKRLTREKKSVRDSIYNSSVNTDRIRPIYVVIDQLSEDDTSALFAKWNTTMSELLQSICIM